MTTMQTTLIAATILATVGTGIYAARQDSTLRSQANTLQQQEAPFTEQIQLVQRERDDAAGRLAVPGAGFASVATPRSQAYAYTVQGDVEVRSIRRSTSGSFYYDVQTNHFELQTKDCRWLVKLGTHNAKVFDYRIVSSDGASTFLLLSYETRQKIEALEGKKPTWNVGDGTVTSGNIPRFGIAEEAGAIWLAYASWCHFAEDPASRRRPVPFVTYVTPVPIGPGQPPAVENAYWQLSDSPPRLPTKLAYSVENTPQASDPSPQGTAGAKPFTNVVYEALSFLDFEGLRLPKESTVSIYRLFPARSGNAAQQLCQQMRVWVTNVISGVELESFKPKLPGTTVISEQRFNNGSGLSFAYLSEDHWPSEPVARNSEAYREAKAELAGGGEDFLPNGTNAPDLSLLWLSGEKQKRLSDYRGRVTVLEFWATWCGPCQTAMAEMQTCAEQHPNWGNKVALIALNIDDDRELAASHVQRKGWTKTDNCWVSREERKAYRISGIPMVYIVDQRGRIAAAGHELDIPKNIDRLLREGSQ